MMSWNGNIFYVTGPLWGESTSHRWIPLTKASVVDIFFDLRLKKNGSANNQDMVNLRCHCPHYDVTVIVTYHFVALVTQNNQTPFQQNRVVVFGSVAMTSDPITPTSDQTSPGHELRHLEDKTEIWNLQGIVNWDILSLIHILAGYNFNHTDCGRDNVADILWTAFWSEFPWMKISVFCHKFH